MVHTYVLLLCVFILEPGLDARLYSDFVLCTGTGSAKEASLVLGIGICLIVFFKKIFPIL